MSLAQQEESVVEFHPLDMLEQSVEDHGWPFERSGRDELNLSVAGRWCDHHFCFTWREDMQSLHLSSAFEKPRGKARFLCERFSYPHSDGTVQPNGNALRQGAA